ncbi:MAG: virulence RhuM family protein [Bifidobacteriaceae bacterium]|nr:virulence RhuM family protein [Bifidobacteriaceae bacterium]
MTGEIVIYQHNGEIKLEITLDNDTLWLTQAQMIELYETSKANLSEHIKNIFDEEELDKTSTVRKFRTVQTEGNRKVKREIDHYNLDMIIAVGYRIKSKIATRFRIWATQTLKEYIIKGFGLDDDRLKELGGGKYQKELTRTSQRN